MSDAMARARSHFLQGVEHFEQGRLDDAGQAFEAALALAPGRPSVLSNLGLTRFHQGRFDDGTLTTALDWRRLLRPRVLYETT